MRKEWLGGKHGSIHHQLVDYICAEISAIDEVSFESESIGFVHFKRWPYVISGDNIEGMKVILDGLGAAGGSRQFPRREKIDHLFVDMSKMDIASQMEEFNEFIVNLDVVHLKLITSVKAYFDVFTERCLDEKKYQIVEIQSPDKYIYIDFKDNIAETNCFDLIKARKIDYLSLGISESMTLDKQNDLMSELDALNLKYLMITLDEPILNEKFRAVTFSPTTHLLSDGMNVISKSREGIDCVEIIYKKNWKIGLKTALRAVINLGIAYRIVFDVAMINNTLHYIIPNIAEYKECKYLIVAGKVTPFLLYIADAENTKTLKEAFEDLTQLTHIQFPIALVDEHQIIRLVLPIPIVFPAINYIVLTLATNTKITDSQIEELLQQIFENTGVHWYRHVWVCSTFCKNRIFVLSRIFRIESVEMDKLKDLIEKPWSLEKEANDTFQGVKDVYPPLRVY